MDKKTILKVFGEAFLRSMVVLMGIAIIGFATFFVIKVSTDKKQLAKNSTAETDSTYSDDELHKMLEKENANDTSTTTEEATTEEVTTEEENIPSTDKKILVLNSTGVAGLAKSWMNKLSGEGFTNIATGNYSLAKETNTQIYVSKEGMGKDLAEYFSDATITVDSLDSGIDVSTDGVDIFIVIGGSDTTVQ